MLQQKLKKLEAVKKNILRSISHELVTYLNGALGYLH
jgi:K+-sensing histidine kinase KdpD